MIKNDRQLGTPFVLFSDTKANIEAIAGVEEGATAYATDSNEFGTFNGATWDWGQGGSFDLPFAIHGADEKTTIHDDDELPGADSEDAWSLIKWTFATIKDTLKTYFDSLYAAISHSHAWGSITGTLENQVDLMAVLNSKRTLHGWYEMSVQPTRTAADDPTYTIQFAGVDYREFLAEGTPVTWLQNSIERYGFISSAPVYSGGNTTVTVLTRLDGSSADYDVLDTGTHVISAFAVALPKQPGLGFPALSEYWDVIFTDTGDRSVGTPGTAIVNPNNMSVTVPIGDWDVIVNFITWIAYTGTNTRWSYSGGLGTANNTFLADMRYYFLATSTDLIANGGYDLSGHFHLTTKQTYYLNVQTGTSGATSIRIRGDLTTTKVRARCRYL